MKKAIIVIAHPYDKSFAWATLDAVKKGFDSQKKLYEIIDLNGDKFNPTITSEEYKSNLSVSTDTHVIKYTKSIQDADEIVLIYPIWWSAAPAIMVGFLQKVFGQKIFTQDGVGKLDFIKRVTVYTTMFTPKLYSIFMMFQPYKNSIVKGTFKALGAKNVKVVCIDRVKTRKLKHKNAHFAKAKQISATPVNN